MGRERENVTANNGLRKGSTRICENCGRDYPVVKFVEKDNVTDTVKKWCDHECIHCGYTNVSWPKYGYTIVMENVK